MPALRAGPPLPGAFFDGTSMYRRKTTRSCASPFGYSRPSLAMLYGAERQKRKADAKAEPLLISVFDPPEPSKHAKHRSGSGEKARVSERSEFRAAPIREERREPMRPHRIGMRPAKAVLVTFAKTNALQQPNGWSK